MFLNDNLNFIIHLFISDKKKINGGLLVLHKLSYKLANCGYRVIIFTEPLFPHKNIITLKSSYLVNENGKHVFNWEGFNYPFNNTISIYPEIINGNPFNTKHVVRWILHEPDNDVAETFGKNDYFFIYNGHKINNIEDFNELTIYETKLKNFYNFNTKRSGFCFIKHKYTPKNYLKIINDYDCIDLTKEWCESENDVFLLNSFNKYKYFLTYDYNSYLTLLSGLCGCIPIILPQDDKQPIEFREENRLNRIGVAYGMNDIDWAVKTNHLIRDYIEDLECYNEKTFKNFIKIIEKKVYGK